MEEARYNPFKSYRYDKYSQPDNESFAEIHQIENFLDTCKRYDIKELNNLLNTPSESNQPLSIMFKNIDGVKSNFDLFSAEINSILDKISIITFAETNLDECNKNLFRIKGYQSIYQSNINGKNKGSGLAIYLKETFLFTVSEEHNQCSPNLETLFITLNNIETPIMIGVAY